MADLFLFHARDDICQRIERRQVLLQRTHGNVLDLLRLSGAVHEKYTVCVCVSIVPQDLHTGNPLRADAQHLVGEGRSPHVKAQSGGADDCVL